MWSQLIVNRLSRLILPLGLMLLIGLYPTAAFAQTDPAALSKAVQEIEFLDAMRSGLASTLEGKSEEPTLQTMKEVCRPVGMRAMQLSQENGWQVKQIASKYRNPDHAPDDLHARMALAKFQQDPELVGFWDRETINNQAGTRYYRRINVEQSCLVCHGLKDQRPQFVKDNYPQDLAYNFRVGDLRGMYSVFIPDLKVTLQSAK
ncbi:Tll0287-like domain-containing protein [Leptodesmis sp.]|uniref:Tll0287-like domain-containing protein n=1 Tax=Leptodesmis sp. TaxID=3100501 RepID=UPI00405357F6